MSGFDRAELEEMMSRFVQANRTAEEKKDWSHLGEFYTDDAVYGWFVGPDEEAMIVGRDEIQRIVFGLEMVGLDNDKWTYPYQRVLIDNVQAEVVGFYRCFAGVRRPDGTPFEAAGIAGSWFHYAGNWKWSWQRDFFDLGSLRHLFGEIHAAGKMSEGMQARVKSIQALKAAGKYPDGHYPIGKGPVDQWELAPGTKPYTPIPV